MWLIGVFWERGRRLAAKVPEAAWKAIERFVALIYQVVYAMVGAEVEDPKLAKILTGTVIGVMVAGLLAGGVAATALVRELTGGGESAAPAAVVAPTAASTPTTAALPTPPLPTATQPAVPGIITVRGTLDVSLYTNSGMNVVDNFIILELPRDGGAVKGTAMVALDNFPIGAALESIHEGLGGSPADYPQLQGCTSVVTLKADDIQGSYSPSPQGATITGSAAFVGEVEDTPCLGGLPPSMNAKDAVQPTTLTLNATFDGHQVQGTFSAPSGKEQKFQATVQ